jgi:hypothetical protein
MEGKYDSAQYFSDSQKQFIPVSSMALPYARNVFAKLLRDDFKNFRGTLLFTALQQRLCPSPSMIHTMLASHGEAIYWVGWTKDAVERQRVLAGVRARFYRAGKKLNVKVETELDEKGDWMIAKCEPVGVEIKVNRV